VDGEFSGLDDFTGHSNDDDHEWQSDDAESSNRFVQFAFMKQLFYLDLPNTTLAAGDAERLMRDRPGFYWGRKQPYFPYHKVEALDTFEPLQKAFVNGDQEEAAAEAAFVFFRLWNCPPDMVLYVRASSFDGKHDWEKSVPMK
jgi:hypothetical protein